MKQNAHNNILNIDHQLFLNVLIDKDYSNKKQMIHRKIFRASDTPLSYRQINTLDNDGYLGKLSREKGMWREFSPYDMVYILILEELKNYGFKHKKISYLWRSFFDTKVAIGSRMESVGEVVIICVLYKIDIRLIVTTNGRVAYYDSSNFKLTNEPSSLLPRSFVQIRLNDFMDSVLVLMRQNPFLSSYINN